MRKLKAKVHRIELPETNLREIEVLHEYGHALMCETVHQCLSTHYFRPNPGAQVLAVIAPATGLKG